jgi:protein-L-isoaspartate(D-aspartate) O-methyltransferase
MTDLAVDAQSANAARARLVEQLLTDGRIMSPTIEAALRTVPRHLFVPDETSVEAAYADDVVITKRGADGKAPSSVSAPWLSLST